jgi:hypothetical protein
MAPVATPDDAAKRQAKRQADSRFKRAEYELEKKCNSVGVEYIKYSPTESANTTKVRRASIRRKIDKITGGGNEEAPTSTNREAPTSTIANRQKKARFQWHENNLKRACEMEVGGMIPRHGMLKHLKYVPPTPSEKAADTKLRRAKLKRQITKMRKVHEKKRLQLRSGIDLSTLKSCYPSLIRREPQNTLVTSPALGKHPVSSGTGRLIDVTPLLLESCGIGQVLWTTLCCGSKTRRIQRLIRKQLDHEKDSGKKQMLNNRCTSWFCCGIGNGVHFVDGELYENGKKHFVAKKLLEQISISGDDLRKIAHPPDIGGVDERDMKMKLDAGLQDSGFKKRGDRMVINVFLQRCARGRSDFSNRSVSGYNYEMSHTGWSVFVDPSNCGHMTRTERKCYCIDIEDIGCIEHGLVDIVEKVEECAPSIDVTSILLEHFGVKATSIDYQGLRAKEELSIARIWDHDITKNMILLAEQAIRDEQEYRKSLMYWSEKVKTESVAKYRLRWKKQETQAKVKELVLDMDAFRDYQYVGPSFVKEEVLRRMEVAKNKLCSIVNWFDVASDEGESVAASMNSLSEEIIGDGQQEVACISQAVQDAKRQAECKMKELDSAFWDFYKKEVTAKQGAANGEVKKINISGQDLRDIIVSKSNGIVESLKVTSTVNVRPSGNVDKYFGGIIDPCSRKFQPTCRVNIDDIYWIENGKVELLYREEQEIFQIRSKGGSRLFATQSVYEARYFRNRRFYVALEQTSQRCKPNELLSCEVVFNKDDDNPTCLGQTDELSYEICRYDGDDYDWYEYDLLYKEVRHRWYPSWWHDGLTLFVTIGPLPENSAYSETDGFVNIGTPEDAYAPLFSESGSKMKIEFSALVFCESALRNGGVLRHIALTASRTGESCDEKDDETEEFHPNVAEEEADNEATISAEEQLDRDRNMSYKDEVEYNTAHGSLDTAATKIQAIWRSYQVRNSKQKRM